MSTLLNEPKEKPIYRNQDKGIADLLLHMKKLK
jgi:hypothetical protein